MVKIFKLINLVIQMNTTSSHFNKLSYIVSRDQNFFLTEKTLTIIEKNNTTKIDLNKITNVRIIKRRELFINYFLVILISIFYCFLNRLMENNFIFRLVLNSIVFISILASFSIKKYSLSILINTVDLNFKKFKMVNPAYLSPIQQLDLFETGHANLAGTNSEE